MNGTALRGGEEWFAIADPGRGDQSHPKAGLLGVDDSVVRIPGATNGCGQVWISKSQLEAEMQRCFILHGGAES